MKKTLFIIILLASTLFAWAADVITTTSSEKIEAKILEVSTKMIKFKKVSNLDGPTFILTPQEISSIKYANGEIQFFNDQKDVPTSQQNTSLTTKYIVTASNNLNVRKQPSGEAPIMGKVSNGDIVEVMDIQGDWGKIVFGAQNGYVSMAHIKLMEESATPVEPQLTWDEQLMTPAATQPQNSYIIDNGNDTYIVNGENMSEWQVRSYLEKNCPSAYNEIQRSEAIGSRCKLTGGIFDILCAAPLGAGIYCYTGGKMPVVGAALLGVCGLFVTISIPCWIVGAVKSNHAVRNGVEVYNMQCARNYVSTPIEFRLQTSQNGIGIAMNF